MKLPLEDITHKTIEICKNAGSYIREQSTQITERHVSEKDRNSLVTHVDMNAERMLVEKLSELLPEAGFITEEKTVAQQENELHWIIDPLDGTTNFIHGVPVYSVSVALYQNNDALVGVVYEISHDECFYAWKNGGAFLNGKPISVSPAKNIEDALIATGFPYYDYSKMENYLEIFKYFMHSTRGLRRLGSAAVDLCYVACGRFDVFYEYALNIWDIAAGLLILKEAGGHASDFHNGADHIERKELLATNKALHPICAKQFIEVFA